MRPQSAVTCLLAAAAFAAAATAPAARAQIGYALSDNGNTLIRFDLSSPGSAGVVGSFSDAAGAPLELLGLDFRPSDGLLYGYTLDDQLVTVDPLTAATTLVSTPSVVATTDDLGIDFNPAADRLRLVNPDDQNLRINVGTGGTTADTALSFAAGDPNEGVDPEVNEAAYTNNDNDPATGTALFYIDNELDALLTTTSPNAGLLTTVGSLGVDTSFYTGFDIFTSAAGVNAAYAILTVDDAAGLYSVNLATGAATLIGAVPGQNVYGLAVAPAAAVPEPGALTLVGAGLLPLAGALARRRRGRG